MYQTAKNNNQAALLREAEKQEEIKTELIEEREQIVKLNKMIV